MLETHHRTNPTMSSPKTSSGPSVTITLDELARAIDQMGLTQSVSVGILYHSILQVQAPPSTPRPPTTLARQKAILQSKSNSQYLWCQYLIMCLSHNRFSVSMESPKDQGLPTMPKEFIMIEPSPESISPAHCEKRHKMVELAKAAFPDGVPSPYTVLDSLSRDQLQFLRATIVMHSNGRLKTQEFRDVLCLWDSGA